MSMVTVTDLWLTRHFPAIFLLEVIDIFIESGVRKLARLFTQLLSKRRKSLNRLSASARVPSAKLSPVALSSSIQFGTD